MRRRNVLLGFGALVFGSGSFIASGAFGSDIDGSQGNWVEANQFEGESTGEVRVQTITNIESSDHRFDELERDDIGVTNSSIIREDDGGFLEGISFESVNADSTTRVGRLDGRGNVDPRNTAFLIANLGGVGTDSSVGETVEIRLQLYDGSAMEESSIIQPGGAVRFPYTIPDHEQHGELLAEDGVVLNPEEILCVAVEINADNADIFDRIEAIGLTIRQPADE